MLIYAVVVEDRHSDVEVELFTNYEQAFQFAKEYAQKYANKFKVEEHSFKEDSRGRSKGFICRITYSGEGDCVGVREIIVDKQVKSPS